jgi:hypothetical protein
MRIPAIAARQRLGKNVTPATNNEHMGKLWNHIHWRKCCSFQEKFSKHLMMALSIETRSAPGKESKDISVTGREGP